MGELTLKDVIELLTPHVVLSRKDPLATIWSQTREALERYNAQQGSHGAGIRTLCMSRDLLIRLLAVRCWLLDFEIRVSETEVGAEFAAYLCAGIDGKKCLQFKDDGSSEMVQYMGG